MEYYENLLARMERRIFKPLLKGCLHPKADQRLTAAQLLRTPSLHNVYKGALKELVDQL